MPVKKRVSKKPRASKSSRSSSRVMKRTQRKSKGKKTRTVKRRKQKAGASIQGEPLKIIRLSSPMYKALLDHINKFEPDGATIIQNVEPKSIEEDIYISIQEPIGRVKDINSASDVDNSEPWNTLIPFIKKYINLILPVDKMAPSCNIEPAAQSEESEESSLQKLKCYCKKLIRKVTQKSGDSVGLLECGGEGE